jgi:acetyltransferase-like isoleucine patch superfamily enzyme
MRVPAGLLKRVKGWWWMRTGHGHKAAALRLDRCGEGSVVTGFIDRREPGGRIEVGTKCLIHGTLITATAEARIVIGSNVFISGHSQIDCVCSVRVEDDVMISFESLIFDSDHHSQSLSVRLRDIQDWRHGYHDWTTTPSSPVLIRRGAWIGARTIILKGVTVGVGSVVGAGAVVTKDVPDWTVVAGNPARVIREIPENER